MQRLLAVTGEVELQLPCRDRLPEVMPHQQFQICLIVDNQNFAVRHALSRGSVTINSVLSVPLSARTVPPWPRTTMS